MERRCLCNVTRDDLAEPQSPQHHPVGRALLAHCVGAGKTFPSIILWGVRINESVDDDAFYNRTNQIAHQ